MGQTADDLEITGGFPGRRAAKAAADALVAAGMSRAAITVTEPAHGGEAGFLWRLILVIVLWSILGGVIGALIGLALAVTIGPDGTTGLVFQVVCWTLIGHLIAGMIAGYWLLADRTEPEMSSGRVAWVVTVSCRAMDAGRVSDLLLAHGGTDAVASSPQGTPGR